MISLTARIVAAQMWKLWKKYVTVLVQYHTIKHYLHKKSQTEFNISIKSRFYQTPI